MTKKSINTLTDEFVQQSNKIDVGFFPDFEKSKSDSKTTWTDTVLCSCLLKPECHYINGTCPSNSKNTKRKTMLLYNSPDETIILRAWYDIAYIFSCFMTSSVSNEIRLVQSYVSDHF